MYLEECVSQKYTELEFPSDFKICLQISVGKSVFLSFYYICNDGIDNALFMLQGIRTINFGSFD